MIRTVNNYLRLAMYQAVCNCVTYIMSLMPQKRIIRPVQIQEVWKYLHLLIEKLQNYNIEGHGNRKGNNSGHFF